MNKAQEAIEAYIDHSCEAQYLRAVLAEHGVKVIADTLAPMLKSGAREQVHAADFFLRDTFSYLPIDERPPFQKAFHVSKTPTVLKELIFSDKHSLRQMAAHTVGILGLDPGGALFKKAFNRFRDTDPLLIPRLLEQILGATYQKDPSFYYRLLDELSSSKSYLSRWTVLEVIDPFAFVRRSVKEKEAQELEAKIVAKLISDESRFVRDQAQWLSDKFQKLAKMRSGDKKEKQAISKDLAAREPRLSFQSISIRFGNELYATGKMDYSIGELDAFVQSFVPFLDGDRLHLRDVMHIYLRERRERGEVGAKEWLNGYLRDGQRFERFKREFKRLWEDQSSSLREKAKLFSGDSYTSDVAATDFLKKIWLDAVGKEWKPQ